MVESSFANPLRLTQAVYWARKDSEVSKKLAKELGVQNLDKSGFLRLKHPKKSANTLFIMGSGPTVNELSNQHFDQIKRNWSIGISHWLVHPFRTDVYSIEQVEDDRYQAVANLLSTRLALLSTEASNSSILYLRPRDINRPNQLISIPESLKRDCYMHGRISPTTQSLQNLEGNLNLTLASAGRRLIPANILLDSGSSVLRMISLGIHSNVKNIVLVGVDLNSSGYFFEGNEQKERFGIPEDYNPWLERSPKHPTDLIRGPGFRFTEMVEAIDRIGQLNGRWKIWAGSPSSALARPLGVYQW